MKLHNFNVIDEELIRFDFIIDPNHRFKEYASETLFNMCGEIPIWFNNQNIGTPAEQIINDNYQHGGGFQHMDGFIHSPNGNMAYPDDPVLHPIALIKWGKENVYIYESGWVSIESETHSWRTARID